VSGFNLPSFDFTPPTPGSGDPSAGSSGSFNQAPRTERDRIIKSVARSRKVKAAASAVIQTRSQFVQYLRQGGLDLVTYAVTFQKTGDFILSSSVVYPKHQGYREPLAQFLQRYPNLQAAAIAIRDQLKPLQNQMDVKSPDDVFE
jgi:hypothetical protein